MSTPVSDHFSCLITLIQSGDTIRHLDLPDWNILIQQNVWCPQPTVLLAGSLVLQLEDDIFLYCGVFLPSQFKDTEWEGMARKLLHSISVSGPVSGLQVRGASLFAHLMKQKIFQKGKPLGYFVSTTRWGGGWEGTI